MKQVYTLNTLFAVLNTKYQLSILKVDDLILWTQLIIRVSQYLFSLTILQWS